MSLNKSTDKGKAAKALIMRNKRIEREAEKKEKLNELKQISDIYKDRDGKEIKSNFVRQQIALQHTKDIIRRGACILSYDAVMYTNIINKYRVMQKKNMAKQVRYQDLNLNDEEKGVLRIIFNRLGLKENRDIQIFFNIQAARYGTEVADEEVERLNIKSGEVIRLLKDETRERLQWNGQQKCYEFRKLEPILTQSIMRQLTMDEDSFMEDELNQCIILRQIINVDNETARIWLAPRRIIEKTKEVGEKVLKSTKNRKSIYDEHRIQAKLEKMENPYMEGIGQDMKVVVGDLLGEEMELDVHSLVRETGASNQIIHTDRVDESNKVSVFLPTYGNYKLAVYQYRGQNEYNQEVLDQYIIEANVGDMIVIRSDFFHNGVASETDGTIIFGYGNVSGGEKKKGKKEGKVNVINNQKMKNGRSGYQICYKGTLPEDYVRNKESDHRLTDDELNLTTLELQMSKMQLGKCEPEYIIFMQNLMFHTLALTLDNFLTASIFEQLGVATGEIDLKRRNDKIWEIYELMTDRKKINRIKKIEEMDVHEWVWYLLTLHSTAKYIITTEYNEDCQTRVRRESKKIK